MGTAVLNRHSNLLWYIWQWYGELLLWSHLSVFMKQCSHIGTFLMVENELQLLTNSSQTGLNWLKCRSSRTSWVWHHNISSESLDRFRFIDSFLEWGIIYIVESVSPNWISVATTVVDIRHPPRQTFLFAYWYAQVILRSKVTSTDGSTYLPKTEHKSASHSPA